MHAASASPVLDGWLALRDKQLLARNGSGPVHNECNWPGLGGTENSDFFARYDGIQFFRQLAYKPQNCDFHHNVRRENTTFLE